MKVDLKLGFLGLFFWSSFGMGLELLLYLEASFYQQDPFLRRLWSLAHAHGTLAWLVYLVYYQSLAAFQMRESLRRIGRCLMAFAASVLPLGFLLGAIGHTEEHPSWLISLVPLGGLAFSASLLIPLFTAQEKVVIGN